MKKSLSQRFALALIMLAVGGIIFAAFLAHLGLTRNFQRYLESV